jgi:flagellar FliL protein
MSDSAAPAPEEPKKSKKGLILIIAGVVGLLVLVVAVVLGTLYAAGVFDAKVDPQAQLEAGDEEHGDAKEGQEGKKEEGKKEGKEGKEGKKEEGKKEGHEGKKEEGKEGGAKSKKSPEAAKFAYTYFQIDREFLVNLTGSKKVLSTQLAIMTHYDERVVENIKKHEFALRSVVLDVLRQTTEADLAKPDYRKQLAVKVRDEMNNTLEKYEDFGGIEEVLFTSFIVQ